MRRDRVLQHIDRCRGWELDETLLANIYHQMRRAALDGNIDEIRAWWRVARAVLAIEATDNADVREMVDGWERQFRYVVEEKLPF